MTIFSGCIRAAGPELSVAYHEHGYTIVQSARLRSQTSKRGCVVRLERGGPFGPYQRHAHACLHVLAR